MTIHATQQSRTQQKRYAVHSYLVFIVPISYVQSGRASARVTRLMLMKVEGVHFAPGVPIDFFGCCSYYCYKQISLIDCVSEPVLTGVYTALAGSLMTGCVLIWKKNVLYISGLSGTQVPYTGILVTRKIGTTAHPFIPGTNLELVFSTTGTE